MLPTSELRTSSDTTFFLVCTPGFEDLAAAEVRAFFPDLKPVPERGGVSVTTVIPRGLELNRWLKIPTRILVRLETFGCRDFPKLFKKVWGYSWESWMSDQLDVRVHASVHGSRVKMKKRIEETVREARIFRLRKRGRPHARFQGEADIFVRMDDDVCTLSLDTSGELLHKRGTRPFSSHAPLRETHAAALLRWMLETATDLRLSVNQIELVDPMTGGGTFLLEAAGLTQPVLSRDFAFSEFSAALLPPALHRGEGVASPFAKLVGFDLEQNAIAAAEGNFGVLAKATIVKSVVELSVRDVFAQQKLPAAENRWVIVNPPYDERIGFGGGATTALGVLPTTASGMSRSTSPATALGISPITSPKTSPSSLLGDYYESLFNAVENSASPKLACFILPEKSRPGRLKIPNAWRLAGQRDFENGGIPVSALLFRRQP